MEKEIKVGVHNCFDFVKRDAKTGKVIGEYKAENIILNNFWGVFLSSSGPDCLKYIHFGSGTTSPSASDVKLSTWVGYKTAPIYSDAGTVYDFSNFYTDGVISIKKSVRLDDTEFEGESFSEVGYSSSTSNTSGLLTKALVKDTNGNAISITKGVGEILDIYATFYVKLGVNINSGEVFWGQPILSNASLLGRLAFYCSTTYPLGASLASSYLMGRPQPQNPLANHSISGNYGVTATGAYDVPNKKITWTIPNTIAANGNVVGGIRGLSLGGLLINMPCTGFAQPVLTKEVVGTGDGTVKDFATKFGYIKDNSTVKVYVDDVEQESGVTIDYGKFVGRTELASDLTILDYTKLDANGIPFSSNALGYGVAENWEIIAENTAYESIPITSITGTYWIVYASNNLTDWYQAGTRQSNTETTVTTTYKNYRYWKFTPTAANTQSSILSVKTTTISKNIHFTNAPADGATVAVTYQPDCIAKDTDHVLNNVSVTLAFNEYTPD